MTSYRWCHGCDSSFHETDARHDSEYNPDARRHIHFLRCPFCGSDDIEDAYLCARCDEYKADFEEGTDDCAACYAKFGDYEP